MDNLSLFDLDMTSVGEVTVPTTDGLGTTMSSVGLGEYRYDVPVQQYQQQQQQQPPIAAPPMPLRSQTATVTFAPKCTDVISSSVKEVRSLRESVRHLERVIERRSDCHVTGAVAAKSVKPIHVPLVIEIETLKNRSSLPERSKERETPKSLGKEGNSSLKAGMGQHQKRMPCIDLKPSCSKRKKQA